MSVGQNALATAFDESDSVAQFALGTRMKGAGDREYVYVQANGAIVADDVVILDETWQADQIDTTNSAGAIGDMCGVAEGAFADDDYGWIQIKGPCNVNVATSAAANTVLNSTATAGRIDDDATIGAETIIGLVTTAAESGNLAAGYLNYPYIGATL